MKEQLQDSSSSITVTNEDRERWPLLSDEIIRDGKEVDAWFQKRKKQREEEANNTFLGRLEAKFKDAIKRRLK